jgi:hypothetical protein
MPLGSSLAGATVSETAGALLVVVPFEEPEGAGTVEEDTTGADDDARGTACAVCTTASKMLNVTSRLKLMNIVAIRHGF